MKSDGNSPKEKGHVSLEYLCGGLASTKCSCIRRAYVTAQYDGKWFWIADTDIQSKYTFGIIMLLFSIADTGVKGSAPVVTIPAQ